MKSIIHRLQIKERVMIRTRIKQTTDSPSLIIDGEVGLIQIKGRALAHKPEIAYKLLENKVTDYCHDPHSKSTVNIKLINLSTSSSKWLYHLLKEIEKTSCQKSRFVINWFYDQEDDVMQEIGEDFKQIINLPFHLLAS